MGQGLLVAGKIQRLEKEFFEAGLDIIGMQETRLQLDADVRKKYYHIIGSAATTSGCYGMQLWVAMKFKAEVLECVPVSPRLLFVALKIQNVRFIIFVAHSPIDGDDLVNVFYDSMSTQLHQLKNTFPEAVVIGLTDLNARVGSVIAPHIGVYGVEQENVNGEHMRLFLFEHGQRTHLSSRPLGGLGQAREDIILV